MFGIATLQAGVLSRFGAILIAIAPLVWLAAVLMSIGDWSVGWWLVIAASLAFLLGWLVIGIAAIRLDQPADRTAGGMTLDIGIRGS